MVTCSRLWLLLSEIVDLPSMMFININAIGAQSIRGWAILAVVLPQFPGHGHTRTPQRGGFF